MFDLSSKAQLISLNIKGIPSIRQKSKIKTTDVTNETYSQDGAVSVTFAKIDKKYIQPLQKAVSDLRSLIDKNSFPWEERGQRIIHNTAFDRISPTISQYKTAIESHFQNFLSDYDRILQDCPVGGVLADERKMPSAYKLASKFSIQVRTRRIPTDDFRNGLSEAENRVIQARFEQERASLLKETNERLFARLLAPVKHLVERLTDPSAERFHASMFTNIQELVASLDDLNITNNPVISGLKSDLEKLGNSSITIVKDSEIYRQEVSENAKEIATTLASHISGDVDDLLG